jgi:hypothetical protein
MKKISNFEKITLALSIVAILFSILSPFITYFLLDPQIQSFKNRARLQISSPTSFMIEDSDVNIEIEDKTASDKKVGGFNPLPRWELHIENIGELPAKDVQIVFRYNQDINIKETGNKIVESINFDTPYLPETKINNNDIFITLNKPIPPQGKIKLKIGYTPDTVTVLNEFGEQNIIQTQAGFAKIYNKLKKDFVNKKIIITPQNK